MDVIVKNKKLKGSIDAISSKSYAHRAIFCSILSKEQSNLEIENLSEDILSSVNVARDFGCEIEYKNKILKIVPPNSFKNDLVFNVGESGTTLRFLIPVVAVLGVRATIVRSGSLVSRTNKVYFDLFKEKGIEISESGEKIFISGKLKSGEFEVDGNISSQFISGLLIALGSLKNKSKIILNTQLQSKPYVDITIDVMKNFGVEVKCEEGIYSVEGGFIGKDYVVERDWSNALFFLISGVEVLGLNKNSIQGDRAATDFIEELGYVNASKTDYKYEKINSAKEFRILDAKNIPDTIPPLCILAALNKGRTKVVNIERLRLKESDRIKSTIDMLENLGVKVEVEENSFSFYGVKEFKSCKINSFNDHRIAMSAAVAATFSNGEVEVLGANSVNKSYIDFFDDFKKLGGEVSVL